MAEVIAGFATVSSILQVVDFAAKLTQHTYHLVRRSTDSLEVKEIIELDRLAGEYQTIGDFIVAGVSLENQTHPGIERIYTLAETCKEQSLALLTLLRTLEVDPTSRGTKRIFQSFRKAIKTQKTRKLIEQDCKHLENVNSQLSMQFLLLLRLGQHQQNELYLRLENAISQNHESSIRTVLDARDEICQAVTRSIAETQSRSPPPSSTGNGIRKYREELKRRFLRSLLFREIHTRRDAISSAYQTTFDWALNDDSLGLRSWLQSESGIFWVSGKAGSGKSTLMRHLVQSDLTKSLLNQWAEAPDSSLVVAEYYFWYAGTKLQKSVEGLLRGLLFQILSHCNDGEQIAFPAQWKVARDYNQTRQDWNRLELVRGIRQLAQACERRELMHENSRCRFCFFIDGLDEFKGDHGQLIGLLKELTNGKQIKICVSSRPWNAFRSAFEESCPSLKLEDLTRSDIVQYVRGSLLSTTSDMSSAESNTPEQPISPSAPTTIDDIAELIVRKAEGVFLWVELVVKSVQEGLREGDPVTLLYQRVQAFPEDLEEFFNQVLNRVNSVYVKNTAMVLKLAHSYVKDNDAAWSISDFTEFWLIRDNLQLIMDNPLFARDIPVRRCSKQELRVMEEETRTFLNACCKDLVGIPKSAHPSTTQPMLFKRVEFLHRTVFDFLSSDELQERLAKDLPEDFGSSDTFRQMALARCKIICIDEPLIAQRRFNAAATFQFKTQLGVTEPMVHQYSALATIYHDTLSHAPDFSGFRIEDQRVREVFTAFQCTDIIMADQELRSATHKPDLTRLLRVALGLHDTRPFPVDQMDPKMVDFLLDAGANLCVHTWKRVLDQWMLGDRLLDQGKQDWRKKLEIFRKFAENLIQQSIFENCVADVVHLRVKEFGELDSPQLETSRIRFLEHRLSEYFSKDDLSKFSKAAMTFHTSDTYFCGHST